MSGIISGGQIFGAIIGLGIVFLSGGVALTAYALGAQIGMFIGGVIDPIENTIKQEGFRLGELATQTSEWGQFIYRLYGTYKLSGNVIWSLDLIETQHVEESGGGKGGGGTKTEKTWYTYSGTWAVALCEGEIESVKKIWLDSVLVYDGTNYSGGLTSGNHTIYYGTQDQPIDWIIQSDKPDTSAYRGIHYIVFHGIELENYGNKIPRVSVESATTEKTVGNIIEDLLIRSGITDYDVSIGSDIVDGYVIANDSSTRAAISQLITAYGYDLIESDFKISLAKRTPDIYTEIPDDKIIDQNEITRIQDVELSQSISISYANKDKNYDAGVQIAHRIDALTDNHKQYQYPLSLSDDHAKKLSEVYLYTEWSERLEFYLELPPEYIFLNPLDYISIDGKLIRIKKISYSGNIIVEGVHDTKGLYNSYSTGDDTGSAEDTVLLQGETTIELLDIPMLDNSLNYEGIYIAAKGELEGWGGCSINKSTNEEVSWKQIGVILVETNIGITNTKLLTGSTTVMDIDNSVTVTPENPLFSITLDVMLNANNYIVIGSEVLQYQTAIDNGDGSYTLMKLLRGRRGTEWAIDTHSAGERFVFLDSNMIFDTTAYLNVDTYYRGITFGDFVEDSSSEFIRPEVICLKPLSPAYLFGSRDSNNNLTLTWERRSRDVTGYLKSLQLFEEVEAYEIEIEGILKTSTTKSYYYSADDQIADGLTPGDSFNVEVFQMSGIVGRGYSVSEVI